MELFDLYDAYRRPTGETMVRGEPTPAGKYRLVVHICIFNSKGEMLIQQRQSFKKSWAGMWDLSAAGGVVSGETSQESARRELFEELGLDVDFEGTMPTLTTSFEEGFNDIYLLYRDADVSTLRLQPEEVQAARWAGRDEILAMIDSGAFIPYHKGLIEYLFFRSAHWGNFDTDK